jgi:hypothetical protein
MPRRKTFTPDMWLAPDFSARASLRNPFASSVALAQTMAHVSRDDSCANCDYRQRAADLVCDRCAHYIAQLKAIYREGGKQQFDHADRLMREAVAERVPLLDWPARIDAARAATRRRKGAAA